MSNRELIERLRLFEASDDLGAGDFSVCDEASDALEEAGRKLAVAREALRYAGDEPNLDRARRIADAALAQIGGEDAR